MAEEKKTEAKKEAEGKELARRGGWMSPFEEFERFFDEAWSERWPSLFRGGWPQLGRLRPPFEGRWPRVDVIDRDEEVVVRAELPGVKKEDLDVTMTDTTVTIKASTKAEEKEEKGQYFRRELAQGEFQRVIGLPQEVDGDKAKATFKDGVLELNIPKVKRTPRKTVKVE